MKKLLVFDFKNDIGSKITICICGHQEINKRHRSNSYPAKDPACISFEEWAKNAKPLVDKLGYYRK